MTTKQVNKKYYIGVILILILTTTFAVYNKSQEAVTVKQFNKAHSVLNEKTDNILSNTDSIKEELSEVGDDVKIIKEDVVIIKDDVKMIKKAVTSKDTIIVYKGGLLWN